MDVSQFQITRLSVTDVTDTCKYPSPQEEESYKDNKVSLTAGRDEASLSFQQSGGGNLMEHRCGMCREMQDSSYKYTKREESCKAAWGE